MDFKPKGKRVLLSLLDETAGGIIIPEDVRALDLPQRKGEIVALPEDEAITSELAIGDKVLFENIGVDVSLEGESYKLVHIEYLHCIIN